MPGLTWNHTEDIALSLYEAHPEVDPTHIRYTDLHKWIVEVARVQRRPLGVDRGQARGDSDGVARGIPGQQVNWTGENLSSCVLLFACISLRAIPKALV